MDYATPGRPQRVYVVDVLRGFAIMGIVLLHSIEHFNFYNFPPTEGQSLFLTFTDKALWDGLFFIFGGKAYAIFALLFGFSFYIQDNGQRERGKDFRLRFLWRLFLLAIIGHINAMFFTGEILVFYAIMGIVLLITCRFPNKLALWLAIICLLQPFEWWKVFYTLYDPGYVPPAGVALDYFRKAFEYQMHGDFISTAYMNLTDGQMANFTWSWEHGRVFQTAGLFILGMLMGRKKLFSYSIKNMRFWPIVLSVALLCFFPLNGLKEMLPYYIENETILASLGLIITSLSNLAFMFILISMIILLYYSSKKTYNLFNKMVPYGRMSLTNYISQSIIGSMLYYNWGFRLSLGITYGFLIGVAIFVLQFMFCRWWMKKHSHGPVEYLWREATWLGAIS